MKNIRKNANLHAPHNGRLKVALRLHEDFTHLNAL